MSPSARQAAALLMAAAAPVYYSTQEPQAEPPPEFKRVCVRCHASDKVMEGRRFASQWEQVLEQMVARGATGTDEEFDVVFDYLVSERGRVAINTAPAEEVAQVLHLSAAIADAIVGHRAKHGKFADFDALAAVPGIDVAELRKRRDAIVF